MSPERTQAYGRITHTLNELGPSKLLNEEQDRVREAADTLIFASDLVADPDAREAIADIEALCASLVESGRWTEITAARLVKDLRECGPAAVPERQAA
ncbi:MAG: hypothetical protein ACXVR1_03410 [Solirubrobacteraceae bacterium]